MQFVFTRIDEERGCHRDRTDSEQDDHELKSNQIEEESCHEKDDLEDDSVEHVSEREETTVIFFWHPCLENRDRRREETSDRETEENERSDGHERDVRKVEHQLGDTD